MTNLQNGPEAHTAITTINWDDFCASGEEPSGGGSVPPRILSISKDAAYVGFFTKNGVQVSSHYLQEADGYVSGYVHCLGDDCPACQAGLKKSQFLLMPVYDHLAGEIALLRISTIKGAGKLATELGKVLSLPEPDKVIAKITRSDRFNFTVDAMPNNQHDPEAIRKVQEFKTSLDNGTIDLISSVTRMPTNEMAEHPRIAKTLQLEGMA